MTVPKVLITSFLESDLVEVIQREVPAIDLVYRPDLLGKPTYTADHAAVPQRTVDQEAEWLRLLADAEIMFDFDVTHRADLPDVAPNVRWIQATSSGIGQFVRRMGYAERMNCVFTTASGVHARPLAEFVIMAMLMFAKNSAYLQSEQAAEHWQRYCGFELSGKTLGIIGLGKIGRETARLAKAFEMSVIGTRRSSDGSAIPNVDHLYAPGDLPTLLTHANFLMLSVPHTPETERLIGSHELSLLPRGAYLINIARGIVVDQDALVDALRTEHLGGAALDVSDPEPLPPGNPLWAMPNVLISPHSASTADSENRKIVALFCENLKHYLSGEPLINRLDTGRLY